MEGWTRKAWGWFKTTHQDHLCVMQRMKILPGGHSSKHLHDYLNNRMIVLEGRFKISRWPSVHVGEPLDVVLTPGDQLFLPATDIHRFHALTLVEAIEIVTTTADEIDLTDIHRFDQGGIRRDSQSS